MLTGETGVLGEKLVTVPLCRAETLRGLAWNRPPVSLVKIRRITTISMARSGKHRFLVTKSPDKSIISISG